MMMGMLLVTGWCNIRDINGTELLKNVDGESPSLLPGKEKSF